MRTKTVFPLLADADRAQAQPILDELARKGFAVSDKSVPPGGGKVVLLFLSAAFAADEELQRRFFEADSALCSIIPVDLDGAEQSELVRSALMAKNAIAASGRTPEEIAARVASADVFATKKSPLPALVLGLALLLALGAGLWLWRGRARESAPQTSLPALAESDLAAARRLGLTPEDLENITSFCIVGDAHGMSRRRFTTDSSVNPGIRTYLSDLAYDSEENGVRHWYSTQDGHEYTLTHYDDLRVIELMPNLRSLSLVLVEADRLPALKGLEKLEEVQLENCRFGDLDWAGEAELLYFTCRSCGVSDFSALGSMSRLREAWIELDDMQLADFSRAGGRSLHNLWIEGRGSVREIDLSGLADSELWELRLIELPVRDLDFLAGQSGLQLLELRNLRRLRSIEPMKTLSSLSRLDIRALPNVNDLTPLGSCERLKNFDMDNMRQIRDLDFLLGCPSLQEVWLSDVDLEDLDFIEPMSHNFGIGVGINGRVGDWSALSLASFYATLSIRPEDGSVAGILPYLAESKVSSLSICNARDLDLAALPEVASSLILTDCPNVEDLSALDGRNTFFGIELSDLPRLRSLEGLEKIRMFGKSEGTFQCRISVENCPRLEDWSALNNTKLSEIRLRKLFTLPDFGALRYAERTVLRLESIPELRDLSFLDAVAKPEKIYFSFELVDMDALEDLGALRRFRGEYLAVMPKLQDQAEALVQSKNFDRFEIAYPAGGWDDNDYDAFQLLSLEELDTLSDAALSHVTSITLAGDQLVDRDRYEVWDEWDGRRHHVLLVDRDSGEQTEVKNGGMSDLSALTKLTGLRRLELYAMPIESLEGIQVFGELEELRVQNCPKLTDASAAFTLQKLRSFEVGRCPIRSIQGVQNCTELDGIYIYETKVEDLSPLREIDYAASLERGGFGLSLGGMDCGDYSALESIPSLRFLDLNGAPIENWPDLSKIGELRELSAHGDGLTQEDLENIARLHPELEELQIPWNREISDLTPLLELRELRMLRVSRDMNKAIESLDGREYGFELEIQD